MHFLQSTFPLFTNDNISQILHYYPSANASVSNILKFATSGNSTPTALNESTFGTGQQQRADVSFDSLSRVPPLKSGSLPATTTPCLISESEPLRRNNIRLPILLARLSLHDRRPQSLQIPILRHRRRARRGRILLRRPPDPEPRPRLQPRLHGHLGQLHHARRPFHRPRHRQRTQLLLDDQPCVRLARLDLSAAVLPAQPERERRRAV